jgi:hypothetical protein
MLPMQRGSKEGSMTDLIETAPKMDLATHDIEPLGEALHTDHAVYSPLWPRRKLREEAPTAPHGVLEPAPHKSIEPRGLAIEGVVPTAVRAMQAFISERTWTDERRLPQHWHEVELDVGANDEALMVDGSDVP